MSDAGFVSHCQELLSPLGRTSSRRMFGGHALYIDDLCMALIIQDTLYLKVDDTHRELFEKAGCRPFTYAGKNDEVHVMSYYTAPDEAMESPAEMMPWARRGLAAAVAARAKAAPKKPKGPPGKKVAAKKAATHKVAPKKAAGKKLPVEEAPASMAAVRAAPAKKVAARKAPAKKALASRATKP